MNVFKEITDSYRQLYLSLVESGFSEEQAFELTKEFCSNTVANGMVDYRNRYREHDLRLERLKKNIQERNKQDESQKQEKL